MDLGLRLSSAAIAFIGLLWLTEWVTRRWSLQPERGRKIAHMVGGVMSAALPLILPFPAAAALSAAFVPFMVVTRRVGIFPLIHAGERSTYGEVFFPLGILGAAVLVPHTAPYAFGVLTMALADPAAGIVGVRLGKRSYRSLWGEKTYAGSVAFLCVTMAIGTGVHTFCGGLHAAQVLPLLVIAGVLTVEEALVGGGADNMLLPVTGAALWHWMF